PFRDGTLLVSPVGSTPKAIELVEMEKPFALELLPGTCQIWLKFESCNMSCWVKEPLAGVQVKVGTELTFATLFGLRLVALAVKTAPTVTGTFMSVCVLTPVSLA